MAEQVSAYAMTALPPEQEASITRGTGRNRFPGVLGSGGKSQPAASMTQNLLPSGSSMMM
jgi:hypothetical protein